MLYRAYDFENNAAVANEISSRESPQYHMPDRNGWLRPTQLDSLAADNAKVYTQHCTYSDPWTGAGWLDNARATSVQSTYENPLGPKGSDVVEIVADNLGGSNDVSRKLTVPYRSGQYVRVSAYLRRGGADWALIFMSNETNVSAYFDLLNGAFGTIGSNVIDYGFEQQAAPFADWYRVWLVYEAAVASAGFTINVCSADATTNVALDGVSSTHMCNPLLEDVSGDWEAVNYFLGASDWELNVGTSNGTITKDYAGPGPLTDTAPGFKFTTDVTVSGIHYINRSIVVPGAGRYWFGAFVKDLGESPWIMLQTPNFTAPTDTSTWNLSSGVVGATNTHEDYGIESFGDGWYHIWVEKEITNDDLNGTYRLFAAEGDADAVFNGAGTDAFAVYQPYVKMKKPNETKPSQKWVTTATAAEGWSFSAPAPFRPSGNAQARSYLGGSSAGLRNIGVGTAINTYSEDFSSWASPGANAVLNSGVQDPYGTFRAYELIDNAATGSGTAVNVGQALTFVGASSRQQVSVWLRKGQLDWALTTVESMGALAITAYWDLANGVVGTTGANVDGTEIEDWGNGWYRCFMYFTSDAADLTGTVRVHAATADGNATVDYDGTSSIHIFGYNAMQHGFAPTPYIFTNGSQVARSLPDVYDLIEAGHVDREGALLVNLARIDETVSASGSDVHQDLAAINATGDFTNSIIMRRTSSQAFSMNGRSAGSDVITMSSGSITNYDQPVSIGLTWSEAKQAVDGSWYVNNSTLTNGTRDTSFTAPISMKQVHFDESGYTGTVNNKVTKGLYVFDEFLEPADLQALVQDMTLANMTNYGDGQVLQRKKRRDQFRRRYRRT